MKVQVDFLPHVGAALLVRAKGLYYQIPPWGCHKESKYRIANREVEERLYFRAKEGALFLEASGGAGKNIFHPSGKQGP